MKELPSPTSPLLSMGWPNARRDDLSKAVAVSTGQIAGEPPKAGITVSWARHSDEVRQAQRSENSRLAEAVERWRSPLIARGELFPMSATLFFSQIVGPAQVFCRAWLSGRDKSDPRAQADTLIACAIRALVTPEIKGEEK